MVQYPVIFVDLEFHSTPQPTLSSPNPLTVLAEPPSDTIDRELRVVSLLDILEFGEGGKPANKGATGTTTSTMSSLATSWLFSSKPSTKSSSATTTATTKKGGRHHHGADGEGSNVHEHRPTVPDADAKLGFDRLCEVITHLATEGSEEKGGEGWIKSQEMAVSWEVPPHLFGGGGGGKKGTDWEGLDGREVVMRTDMDVNGFLRTFWPRGYHEPAAHTPILKVDFSPEGDDDAAEAPIVHVDVNIAMPVLDTREGGGEDGEEIVVPTATIVKPEEEEDDQQSGGTQHEQGPSAALRNGNDGEGSKPKSAFDVL
ncbi:hypothetical protein CF327_g3677 [Tilletia walkeri]|nr:hypothetical protein CF327_g3677 [Tilletia walkeri]